MKKKHIRLLLCFLWMTVIFLFSNQPADESQGMSNTIIQLIENILHIDIMNADGWLFDTMSFLVRKAAHMSEYAILAILYRQLFDAYETEHSWLWALLGVMLYAATDEFHQVFIPGRSGAIKDVMIDSCGGAIGLLVLNGFYRLKAKYRMKKQ